MTSGRIKKRSSISCAFALFIVTFFAYHALVDNDKSSHRSDRVPKCWCSYSYQYFDSIMACFVFHDCHYDVLFQFIRHNHRTLTPGLRRTRSWMTGPCTLQNHIGTLSNPFPLDSTRRAHMCSPESDTQAAVLVEVRPL